MIIKLTMMIMMMMMMMTMMMMIKLTMMIAMNSDDDVVMYPFSYIACGNIQIDRAFNKILHRLAMDRVNIH
jgi:hypothetical protein